MADNTDSVPGLHVGEKVTLEIRDLAFGGEGVGRASEFVVFVPFVIPGETVAVEVTEVKKNFARARLVEILVPSPERVTPACPHFGACGGCQYQHIDYAAQLRFKHKQISDLFQRIGGFDGAVIDPVVPCPQPYGYRNRLMVRSQWNKPEQKLNIGFLRHDNRLVEDVVECKIAEPALNQQLQQLRANPPPRGGIKVTLRVQADDWVVPKDSFFQNNFFLLPKLVEVVRARLEASGVRHLVDVYCGVGFFALECASAVDSFVGVELDQLAVKAARENAIRREVRNGDFITGRAEQELPHLARRFSPEKTAVILDPPRTGCPPESLRLLREVGPRQIIYVSCHPATLARDLKLLCEENRFRLERVTPLDMFPQTQHVECVGDLRREK